ncbi:MAG: nucleotidyltransferase domain-containing protein [Candidatus Thorarchaeota archaeon]
MIALSRKPEVLHERRVIIYDSNHWKKLDELRSKASEVLLQLKSAGMDAYVYGSVARGDTSRTSDIDIVILDVIPSYRVELSLGKGVKRELIQATPSSVLKAHLHLDIETVVSFPLFKMMSREREFYQWGGLASLQDLSSQTRKPGVDKRLVLIEPTDSGHTEQGVIDYEWYVSKTLGVSLAIAQERVRVLKRRDAVGRTGVYRTYQLADDETFEIAAKKLTDSDPALRRTIRRRE